jgi:hypothetical protein
MAYSSVVCLTDPVSRESTMDSHYPLHFSCLLSSKYNIVVCPLSNQCEGIKVASEFNVYIVCAAHEDNFEWSNIQEGILQSPKAKFVKILVGITERTKPLVTQVVIWRTLYCRYQVSVLM